MRTDGNDHLHRLDVDNLHIMSRDVFSALSQERVVALANDNEIILRHHSDTSGLRREFINNGLMERQGGGGLYWRIPWQMPELR